MTTYRDWNGQPRSIEATLATASMAHLIAYIEHHDGHLRQAAIERALAERAPGLLPLLVERLNDWVPQVRDTARNAVLALLPTQTSHNILAVLPRIAGLRGKGRTLHQPWLERFETALLSQMSTEEFLAAVNGRDMQLARAAFDLLQRHALLGPAILSELALSSRADIVLAVRAAASIAQRPSGEQLLLYTSAMKSHFGPVRTMAIQGVLRVGGPEEKHFLAQACLFDPQSSVRSSAIAFLAAQGVDVKATYRALLAAPDAVAGKICIALASLAGLRDPSDVELVQQFTKHPLASVRRAACQAWLRLAPSDKDTVAMTALDDDSSSLKKLGLDMVRRGGAFIPFDVILTRLLSCHAWWALLAAAKAERWNWLEAIASISQATDAPPEIRVALKSELIDWMAYNRAYTRPTGRQIALFNSIPVRDALRGLSATPKSFEQVLQRELELASRSSSPSNAPSDYWSKSKFSDGK